MNNAANTTGAAGALAAAVVITLVLVLQAVHYSLPDTAQAIYMAALTYLFGRWMHIPDNGNAPMPPVQGTK